MTRIWLLLLLVGLTGARAASAQTEPMTGRFEAGVMAMWLGSEDLGERDAELVRNVSTTPFPLFTASGSRSPAPAFFGTFGYRLTPLISVEGSAAFSQADLEISIRDDVEGAPSATFDGERLTTYTFSGSAIVRLPVRWRARVWPYLLGGAGYRRELHEDRAELDQGLEIHGGGGVRWLLSSPPPRPPRRLKGTGVRIEARVTQHRDGFTLDRPNRVFVSVGGGVFFMF
jgi:hypothetical protein